MGLSVTAVHGEKVSFVFDTKEFKPGDVVTVDFRIKHPAGVISIDCRTITIIKAVKIRKDA